MIVKTAGKTHTMPQRFLQEAVRVKRLTSKRAAVRDLLFGAIADYNRTVTNKVGLSDLFSSNYLLNHDDTM